MPKFHNADSEEELSTHILALLKQDAQKTKKQARSNAEIVDVPAHFHAVVLQEPKATRKEYPFEGYIDFQGIQIDVENAKGSTRSGSGPEGDWSVYMNAHYGEIRGTEGLDGDKLDVYVGENHDSSLVVVIHQFNPWDGTPDEDKVILGCDSIEEAIGLYKSQYNRPGFYREGEYLAMPIGAFWRWVHEDRNRGKKVKLAAARPLGVPAVVTRIRGNQRAFVSPLTPETAPATLATGHWYKTMDAKVGDKGVLVPLKGDDWVFLMDKDNEQWGRQAGYQMTDAPVLQIEAHKGWALLQSGGSIDTIANLLNTHLVRRVPSPMKVAKPQGVVKAFSFHWSNAQGKWDVISLQGNAFPKELDGAEFLLFMGRRAVSPTGKSWSLPEMRYIAQKLNHHPGFAFAMRSAAHDVVAGLTRQAEARARGGELLTSLLANLRAIGWNYLTSHWQAAGVSSYGDHLLFERLYSKVTEETDALAEKIAGLHGAGLLDIVGQAHRMNDFLYDASEVACPIQRGIKMEQDFMGHLQKHVTALREMGGLSLGLDDMLLSMANDHETHLYLLQQRHGGVVSPQSRLATKYLLRRAALVAGSIEGLGYLPT